MQPLLACEALHSARLHQSIRASPWCAMCRNDDCRYALPACASAMLQSSAVLCPAPSAPPACAHSLPAASAPRAWRRTCNDIRSMMHRCDTVAGSIVVTCVACCTAAATERACSLSWPLITSRCAAMVATCSEAQGGQRTNRKRRCGSEAGEMMREGIGWWAERGGLSPTPPRGTPGARARSRRRGAPQHAPSPASHQSMSEHSIA